MAKKTNGKKSYWLIQIATFIISGLFIFFLFFFLRYNIVSFFTHMELFRIKQVVTAPSLQFIPPEYLAGLKGQGIFDVNLELVQKRLQTRYPEINNLRVVRRFPDRIYIVARKREPAALVSLGRQEVLLDKEGIVLSMNAGEDLKLPLITGLRSVRKIGPGASLRSPEINAALEIIGRIQGDTDMHGHALLSIDVSSLSKISLRLTDNLQVILDSEKIEPKIQKLGILLSQGGLNLQDVKYIDLRFQEPTLGKNKI